MVCLCSLSCFICWKVCLYSLTVSFYSRSESTFDLTPMQTNPRSLSCQTCVCLCSTIHDRYKVERVVSACHYNMVFCFLIVSLLLSLAYCIFLLLWCSDVYFVSFVEISRGQFFIVVIKKFKVLHWTRRNLIRLTQVLNYSNHKINY